MSLIFWLFIYLFKKRYSPHTAITQIYSYTVIYIFLNGGFMLFQDEEFLDDPSKFRSELPKDKYDESNDNKEMNTKYLPLRLQKQFEQNNDASNKAQNVSSTSKMIIF